MTPNKKVTIWMKTQWRPVMAFVFMAIIIFDFIIAPILWSLLQAFFEGSVIHAWAPLTLGSGGMFYIAMGGILGVAAFSRGKEKLELIKQNRITDEELEEDLEAGDVIIQDKKIL